MMYRVELDCKGMSKSLRAAPTLIVLAMCACATCSEALGVTYQPIATSGHDVDIVYEIGLSAGQAGANGDIGSRQFYEQGVSTQTAAHKPGLTRTMSATPLVNTINFAFEPFELNNALKFNAGTAAKTLTLEAPAAYDDLAFVFSAGGLQSDPAAGPLETATIPYTVNYAGGLTQTGSLKSPDWSILSTPATSGTGRLASVGRIGNSPPPVWPQTPEVDARPNRWNVFVQELALSHSTADLLSVTFGPVTIDDADGQLNADDDVVVFGLAGVLTPDLTLEVNTITGAVRFANPAGSGIALSGYEITSAAGSLNLAEWNSFSDQNLDPVDGPDAGTTPGDGAGETWDEAGGASNFALQEGFLLGSSIVPSSGMLPIGAAYNTTLDARDLVASVRRGDGSIAPVAVTYDDTGLPGDFDGDWDVDADDLTVWQANFGSSSAGSLSGDADGDSDADGHDFLVWQRNLSAAPASVATAVVPEASGFALSVLAGCALTWRRPG
jgi:hypothetical protein